MVEVIASVLVVSVAWKIVWETTLRKEMNGELAI